MLWLDACDVSEDKPADIVKDAELTVEVEVVIHAITRIVGLGLAVADSFYSSKEQVRKLARRARRKARKETKRQAELAAITEQEMAK